jgi:hypothetical protein
MIKEYNNKSLLFGIPGLILQIVGRLFVEPSHPVLGFAITLIGTILLLIGFALYAKAKGRHPAWCLMALLSIIGLIILACLKDKTKEE